ncbi:plasmid replication, integration and excision activator [Nonomuraea sp. NBC_01738]|uniref:plasmid replication, integration and excision activator n=1 Tax=Nonomuraea sp. NBC_01738 TaxID=2976003 RepID=UPI002E0D5C03|nr:plasmid replication, integration and excision activator [Nonomuraea sp. NBC_01738]
MTLRDPIPVHQQTIWPVGVFVVGEVTPVNDFGAGSRDNPVRKLDSRTGELMWAVPVMDANPEARAADRALSVKVLGAVPPVIPEVPPQLAALGLTWVPVEFEGLTVLPYVNANGRLEWSIKARGVRLGALGAPTGEGRTGGHSRSGSTTV